MSVYLSPGVYPKETDFSFYVKQISTSVAGMVGVAEKGPFNQAVLVTSWEQFSNKFGSYINEGYLAYAARAFFDNGGSMLYVCRIAHSADLTDAGSLAARAAEILIPGQIINLQKDMLKTSAPPEAIKIYAVNGGVWGDKISVTITDGNVDPVNTFNIMIKYKSSTVEVFKDLSLDEQSASHVELLINGRSEYICVQDLNNFDQRPASGTYQLSGGENGLKGLNDADYIGDSSVHSGIFAFDEVADLNLLMVPGVTTVPVINAGIAYAESRKDLLFLADTPLLLEPQEAVDFRKGQGIYSHGAFNSSYAALYYPWLEIADPVTAGKKLVPPTGAVAGCIARSDQKTAVWYAPAGIDRGRIFNAVSAAYKTSRGERDLLYPEGINVIAVFSDSGINIWGQRTLQSQPSAVDRINVRRLMMYMEKAISQSAKFVVFEPNHPQTWRVLSRLINPFMQDIREKGGVYDYAFQCDEETNTPAVIDRNEMVARVFVKPTKTAEFIELNFILTGSGADFKEIM